MYIAIEGVDGVGKTTTLEVIQPVLNKFVTENDLPEVRFFAETEIKPTHTFKSEKEKQVYLAMSYALQRMNILSLLNLDKHIYIADRSVFSSYAYQGKCIQFPTLKLMNKCCVLPDHVILIKSGNIYFEDYDMRYISALRETKVPYTTFDKYEVNLTEKIITEIIGLIIKKYSFKISENWLQKYNKQRWDILD